MWTGLLGDLTHPHIVFCKEMDGLTHLTLNLSDFMGAFSARIWAPLMLLSVVVFFQAENEGVTHPQSKIWGWTYVRSRLWDTSGFTSATITLLHWQYSRIDSDMKSSSPTMEIWRDCHGDINIETNGSWSVWGWQNHPSQGFPHFKPPKHFLSSVL